jgi:histidine phosphotransferase ChpT
VPLILLPKHKAKLLMNMLLIAAGSVPRGGLVTVKVSGPAGEEKFEFNSKSDPEKRQKTLIPSGSAGLLSGMPEEGSVDARGIQPFYTGLLARMTDMEIDIGIEADVFFFTAIPKAKEEAVVEEAKAETSGE